METRPAATIVLVRQSAIEPELLLVQRTLDSTFAPGAWVFPGGALDTSDDDLWDLYPRIAADLGLRTGLEPRVAAAYLGAAVREAWEETGILIGASSFTLSSTSLSGRTLTVRQLVSAAGALPGLGDTIYLSRWVTPSGQARRYDTRFFLAEVGSRVEVLLNQAELADFVWIGAAEALRRHSAEHMPMMRPTLQTVRSLAEYPTVTGMLRGMREQLPGSYLPALADEAPR